MALAGLLGAPCSIVSGLWVPPLQPHSEECPSRLQEWRPGCAVVQQLRHPLGSVGWPECCMGKCRGHHREEMLVKPSLAQSVASSSSAVDGVLALPPTPSASGASRFADTAFPRVKCRVVSGGLGIFQREEPSGISSSPCCPPAGLETPPGMVFLPASSCCINEKNPQEPPRKSDPLCCVSAPSSGRGASHAQCHPTWSPRQPAHASRDCLLLILCWCLVRTQ